MTEETIASLDSILEGDSEETAEVEQKTEAKAKAEAEDEATKEAETEEAKGEKSETPAEKDTVPIAAQIDERRKRQAAEKKAKELEDKLAEFERRAEQTNKEPPKRPDPTDDPEGAYKALEGRILAERINLSREMMMDSKADFPEMEKIFVDLAKQNLELVQQMNASPNPAKFAYTKAKEHNDYQEFLKTRDSEEYKAFLESKKAKLEQPEETIDEKRKKSAVSVPDLVNATSGSLGTKPVKRAKLDDILPD